MNCSDYRDHVRRIEGADSFGRAISFPCSYTAGVAIALCGIVMACFLVVPSQSARMSHQAFSREHQDSHVHLRDDSPFLWLGFGNPSEGP